MLIVSVWSVVRSSTLVVYNDLNKTIFVRLICTPPIFGKKCHCSETDAYYKVAPGGSLSAEGNKFYGVCWMNFSDNKEYEVRKKEAFQTEVEVGGGHFAILENGIDYTYDKGIRLESGRKKAFENKNVLGSAKVIGALQ